MLPEIKKHQQETKKYRDQAITLNIENMRMRKLQKDIPTQLQEYLDNLAEENNILEFEVLGDLPMGQDPHDFMNQGKKGRNGQKNKNRQFQNKGSTSHSQFGSTIQVDQRPKMNVKLIEPMDPMDDSDAINKKIEK